MRALTRGKILPALEKQIIMEEKKMKKTKQMISLLLSIIMTLSLLPPQAFAADIVASGYCGGTGNEENVAWSLDSNGILTIRGNGAMRGYKGTVPQEGTLYKSDAPWFVYKDSITSLIIENGVTCIGESAFAGCSEIISVQMPDTIDYIYHHAFAGCTSLIGEFPIGANVYLLQYTAFDGCTGITGLRVENSNENYTSQDGILYNKNLTELIFCPRGKSGSLTIAPTTEKIAYRAFFRCTGLNGNLVIPNCVAEIGNDAFYGCSGFRGMLDLPVSITKIGESVFANCSGLSGKLTLPANVTEIGNYAFQSCSGFSGELVLPGSLTTIGANAFYGCVGLTGDLVLPDSVVNVKSGAFEGCTGFTGKLTLSRSMDAIRAMTFYGCSGLSGELEIPSNITVIEQRAFEGCTGFTGTLDLPDNITTMGHRAFYHCKGITGQITIPSQVTTLEKEVFGYCPGIESFIIPEGVTKIAKDALPCGVTLEMGATGNNLKQIYFKGDMPQFDYDESAYWNHALDLDSNVELKIIYGKNGWLESNLYNAQEKKWDNYKLIIEYPIRTYSFKVLDSKTKEPLANVNVAYPDPDGSQIYKEKTDANGMATLSIPACPDRHFSFTGKSLQLQHAYLNELIPDATNVVYMDKVNEPGGGEGGGDENEDGVALTQSCKLISDKDGYTYQILATVTNHSKENISNVQIAIGTDLLKLAPGEERTVNFPIVHSESSESYSWTVYAEYPDHDILSKYFIQCLYQNGQDISIGTFGDITVDDTVLLKSRKNEFVGTYNVKNDTWKFENPAVKIEEKYWKVFFPKWSNEMIKKLSNNSGGGLCSGMVFSTINMHQLHTLNDDSNEYISLQCPENFGRETVGTIEKTDICRMTQLAALSYIKIMQTAQYNPCIQEERKNNANDLLGLYKAIKEYEKDPCGIGVEIGVSGRYFGNQGHSLWGVKAIDYKNMCKILVYDCNHPGEDRYLILNKDESGNFISWSYVLFDGVYGIGRTEWGTNKKNATIDYSLQANVAFAALRGNYTKQGIERANSKAESFEDAPYMYKLVSVSQGNVHNSDLIEISVAGVVERENIAGDPESDEYVLENDLLYWSKSGELTVSGMEGINAEILSDDLSISVNASGKAEAYLSNTSTLKSIDFSSAECTTVSFGSDSNKVVFQVDRMNQQASITQTGRDLQIQGILSGSIALYNNDNLIKVEEFDSSVSNSLTVEVEQFDFHIKYGGIKSSVTFEPNGGTLTPATAVTNADGTLDSLPTPTRDGYTFTGWFTAAEGGTAVTTETVFTEDTTVYAHWTENAPTPPVPPVYPVVPVTPPAQPAQPTQPGTPAQPGVTAPSYTDVAPGSWYYDAVAYVSGKGLMTGTGANTFAPDAVTSRAMMWTILARMSGAAVDGGEPWYVLAQTWAVANGVSDGTDPDGRITREQLVTMLYRYAGEPAVADGELAGLSAYADSADVSEYAQKAMAWAVSNGIINGIDGRLVPQGPSTRAQVAAILMRYCENILNK